MDHRGPEVSEEAVAAYERTIGATLPDAYRAFLLSTNGGRLASQNRRFTKQRFVVNLLFSLDDPDDARRLGTPGDRDDTPSKDLLRVGYDSFGNEISVAVGGEHRGEVWYWKVTDARGDGGNPRVLWHDRRDMVKLADNFDEFLAGLGPLKT